MRSYRNLRHNGTVTVILMCGRAGRMSVHTPEVCYRGAGYEMHGAPAPLTVKSEGSGQQDTLWTARFTKHAGVAADLRLYWAWNADGAWQAPASPRWTFRGEPFLYKLYVSQDGQDATGSGEAAHGFLRRFLPEAREFLFSTSGQPEG
jgi:hypothetical protein